MNRRWTPPTIRWGVVFVPWCWAKGHDRREYAVIHMAWNWPGWYCPRCGKSVVDKTPYTSPPETQEKPPTDLGLPNSRWNHVAGTPIGKHLEGEGL